MRCLNSFPGCHESAQFWYEKGFCSGGSPAYLHTPWWLECFQNLPFWSLAIFTLCSLLRKVNSISCDSPTHICTQVHLTVFRIQWIRPLHTNSSLFETLFYSLVPKSFCFLLQQQHLSNTSLCKQFLFSSFPWCTPSSSWPLTNFFSDI